ncbi:uncharacterized protein B0H18DRAFT_1123094 [Fomitopsis serialis]|uniref:uncharacterized protein n=1 Tax=Fomitopsis serialis TaxID=139415 RepID=UPI0020078E2C|nr:uncharacterized protein B0H18DRAFT_1123094 [Neoantrodia serialis]KAH9918310.1 hypothetical protein B0H18DRAFT_1123094 [Neoantrodia serialis]
MRYSTLVSAILFAATAAPALALPFAVRSGGDASIAERGYYDDLVSRAPPKPQPARVSQLKKEDQQIRTGAGEGNALRPGQSAGRGTQHSGGHGPHASRPQRPRSDDYDLVERDLEARNEPWAPRSDYEWFARGYDLDGELFERDFEADELFERGFDAVELD